MAKFLDVDPRAAAGLHVPKHLTPQDQALLARAPRKDGTRVTVRAYDIPRITGPLGQLTPDHMYVEYDDGRDQLIARGGPNDNAGAALSDEWTVTAGVTSARKSRDYGRGGRVLFQGFLPGQTAQQAAAPARAHAEEVNQGRRRYGWGANSNSYAADVVERLFGVRPGDSQTPGYRQRLRDAPRIRAEPIDLSPALRGQPY
ncbi:MAG: hypothetical protein ACOY5Y_12740 [Pseudomonadota bacterium]